MSHFIVLVIGSDVEGILAPYSEEVEVDPYIDIPAEEVRARFDECRKNALKVVEDNGVLSESEILIIDGDLKEPTSQWAEVWYGQELDDEGNLLTSYNPDGEYDWYQIGGRWSGTLILKPGCTGDSGERSWSNENAIIPEDRCDSARICDVDWDAMNVEAAEEAAHAWDTLFNSSEESCHYKPEYVEAQRKLHLEMYKDKDDYVKRRGIWTPFAVVNRDGWFAKGDMGWFGMSSDETGDREDFIQTFQNILENTYKTTTVTMVDCHI